MAGLSQQRICNSVNFINVPSIGIICTQNLTILLLVYMQYFNLYIELLYHIYYTNTSLATFMYKLSVACPLHNLPYEHVVITENNPYYLRCKKCPFQPTSLRISNQIQYMKARMGEQKSKQREKSRSRSKSRSKSKSKGKNQKQVTFTQKEDEDQIQICQKIAQEQVLIVQLVMKLLTEDKKKYFQKLDKTIQNHRSLWKQYSQSATDLIFLNKMCKNELLNQYIKILSSKGWENMKRKLCQINSRNYICRKLMKQSKQICEQLKKQAQFNQNTVLKSMQTLLQNSKIKNNQINGAQKTQNNSKVNLQKISFKNNKRSKSFGA